MNKDMTQTLMTLIIKNYINLHTWFQHHYVLIIVWQMVDYHYQPFLTKQKYQYQV